MDEADWETCRHSLDRDIPRPFVHALHVSSGISSNSTTTVYMIKSYRHQTAKYVYVMKSFLEPNTTLELQDLSPHHIFSLMSYMTSTIRPLGCMQSRFRKRSPLENQGREALDERPLNQSDSRMSFTRCS